MSDSDFLVLQQQLYLVACHVEATVSRWLEEACNGYRRTEIDELRSMQDLLAECVHQRGWLANCAPGGLRNTAVRRARS